MTEPADTPDSTPASIPSDDAATTEQTGEPGRGSRWQAFTRAPRAVRWTAWTALGLVVLLVVLAAVTVVVVRRPLPQTDGEIEVPGLSASVEVVRDEQGIAQVYADTDADLMFAQGFVHAQDRFFEMDFRRHVTAGRLSEIFGAETLETDKLHPHDGLATRRRARVGSAGAGHARRADAYAAGVNAYIADRTPVAAGGGVHRAGADRPRLPPEEWTPVDSLAWLKAMAWDLRGNMDDEVDRALALARPHRGRDRRAVARLPLRRAPADRQPAALSSTGSSSRTPRATRPATPAGRRTPRASSPPSSGVRDRLDAMPELHRQGPTASAATPGSSTASTPRPASRSSPTTRTSASAMPGIWMQMGLHCRASTADCPLDVVGLHVLRGAGRDHRPQRRHRLGLHQPRPRRHRPLPRADRRATTATSATARRSRWRSAPRRSRCAARTTSR